MGPNLDWAKVGKVERAKVERAKVEMGQSRTGQSKADAFTQTRLMPAFRVSTGLHVEHRRPKASDAPHGAFATLANSNFGQPLMSLRPIASLATVS